MQSFNFMEYLKHARSKQLGLIMLGRERERPGKESGGGKRW
jgi:hypothetical protein